MTASITKSDETLGIEEVRPYDRNPRRHPEKQIAELVRSLEQFGQYRPLVVDEEGVILAGNGIYAALKRTGATEVKVHRITGLTEDRKVKLVLTDNRTSDLSSDDFEIVEELLAGLSDFDVPGYDPEMIEELLATAEELTAEAVEYGKVDPAIVERLRGRERDVDAENAQATRGTPPAPLPADDSTPTPQSTPAASAADGSSACPTCGRAW